MRVESLWTWLTFIIAYAVTRGAGEHSYIPWKFIVASGSAAAGFYVIYAIIFYPLAFPWHYLAFVKSLKGMRNGVPGYKLLFVAGGLLWIGALASLVWFKQSRVMPLGWLWLVACSLPWLPAIFLGVPSQTRMLTLLISPIFLVSAGGWALLLQNGIKHQKTFAVVGLGFCMFLVSEPTVYSLLRDLPGGWRLQSIRAFLAVPLYERIDYLPNEIQTLSHSVYKNEEPTVLISTQEITQEYLNLIRFFGKAYLPNTDMALLGDPTNRKKCDSGSPNVNEIVFFCTGYSDLAKQINNNLRYRILTLRPISSTPHLGTKLILSTPTFALDEITD